AGGKKVPLVLKTPTAPPHRPVLTGGILCRSHPAGRKPADLPVQAPTDCASHQLDDRGVSYFRLWHLSAVRGTASSRQLLEVERHVADIAEPTRLTESRRARQT